MHIRPGLILISAVALLLSCRQQPNTSMVNICGKADLKSGPDLRLIRIDTSAYVPVDSLKPGRNGTFCMNIKAAGAGLYLLMNQDRQLAPLVLYPGDSITAEIVGKTTRISGGKEAGLFDRFRQQLLADESAADSLGSELLLARDLDTYSTVRQKTDSAWMLLLQKAKNRGIQYIVLHPAFLSQLLVVNSKIQQTFVFDQQSDTTWLFRADSQLMKSHPESEHVQAFHRRMEALRTAGKQEQQARETMKPGKTAPAISLPGLDGNPVSLNPLKNKYTLVFFWSATNAVSRKTARELKVLRDKYRSRGFEVYAVCFDPYPDRWIAAVNLDKLWWINVNEKQEPDSPLAREWFVKRLPVMVLLDHEAKIISRFTNVNELNAALTTKFGK